jgi:hypothetical protein
MIFSVLGVFSALAVTSASAQCLTPRGDLNGDGTSNVVDIQCAVFVALNAENNPSNPPACLAYSYVSADANCDDSIDVTDVLILVNHAVGAPIAASLDADGNNCVDACQTIGALVGDFAWADGDSASPSWTLQAVGTGFPTGGASGSASFQLQPLALGAE